jgi:hypothetical protein
LLEVVDDELRMNDDDEVMMNEVKGTTDIE